MVGTRLTLEFWRRTANGRRRLTAAVVAIAALLGASGAPAQTPPIAVVEPGEAAVTGFSGALPPIQIAPGVDPGERTFIDLNGPSLRVFDLRHMHGQPAAQLVGAPKPFTFTAAQVGQVFGVALDDNSPPNIYAAATSAYGLPIVVPSSDGQPRHIKTGAPNATFMPGLWGPQGGPGSIWKIDGVTGRVSRFANVTLSGRPNSGAALGGLAFDPESKSLFVSDQETGFIYRFGTDGTELGRYDHGVTGRAAVGLPPIAFDPARKLDITSPQFDSTQPASWNYAAPERRVFGLAVYQHRLYYAVADSMQIWSVGLKADGSFGDDALIELAVPPSTGPTEISKISFDEQGRMFIGDRPAPTGAFDFEALAVPAIGRVLRYAVTGAAPGARRIWQEEPDEYAIGFPHDLRNGNGGVAIGYNYDRSGDIIGASCGGFMWTTGEDLRNSPDAALATRLSQSGPLHVNGLQGNGTWRIRRHDDPPLASYFIEYVDEFEDEAARGHMGDIAIERQCTPAPHTSLMPPIGGPPGGGPPGGGPPGGGAPGGGPPGGGCSRPSIQIGGKCCTVGELAAGGGCSNSICKPGQTTIGPSNFCCNNNQVYNGAGGAQACCNAALVNGQCPTPTPKLPTPICQIGYVPVGGSCCLASQMTSTGICCPAGQAPSGPNESQCVPYIPIHVPPLCCPAGQIPTSGPKPCCPPANVTTSGVCCPGSVDANNRSECRTLIPLSECARGFTRMPDGSCCNNRFVGADGTTCNTGARPCPPGEFRELGGACVPILAPNCPAGEVRDRHGDCVSVRPQPRRLRPEMPRHPLAPPPPRRGRAGPIGPPNRHYIGR